MNVLRNVALVGLLVAPGLLAGCKKEVNITFVNGTRRQINVQVRVPSEGIYHFGLAAAMGGKRTFKLKITEENLPVLCLVQAGDQREEFEITKNWPKERFIHVDPTGLIGPVDKKDAITRESKIEFKDIQVGPPTEVVE